MRSKRKTRDSASPKPSENISSQESPESESPPSLVWLIERRKGSVEKNGDRAEAGSKKEGDPGSPVPTSTPDSVEHATVSTVKDVDSMDSECHSNEMHPLTSEIDAPRLDKVEETSTEAGFDVRSLLSLTDRKSVV